jgi:alpha-glucosidase
MFAAPASVTMNGKPVAFAKLGKPGGWNYEGNTLTTIVPVPVASRASKVIVEVRRATGLTARRPELDGFTG